VTKEHTRAARAGSPLLASVAVGPAAAGATPDGPGCCRLTTADCGGSDLSATAAGEPPPGDCGDAGTAAAPTEPEAPAAAAGGVSSLPSSVLRSRPGQAQMRRSNDCRPKMSPAWLAKEKYARARQPVRKDRRLRKGCQSSRSRRATRSGYYPTNLRVRPDILCTDTTGNVQLTCAPRVPSD